MSQYSTLRADFNAPRRTGLVDFPHPALQQHSQAASEKMPLDRRRKGSRPYSVQSPKPINFRLDALLPTPSSGPNYPHRTLLRLRLYYELVRLPHRHTSALPLRLVGGFPQGERRGSPKFRDEPLKHLPRTPTPARRRSLAISRATLLASSENKPWPSGDNTHFGAEYLHLRCGRRFAVPPASRNSLPPCVRSSVPAWWLAFGRVGLSN